MEIKAKNNALVCRKGTQIYHTHKLTSNNISQQTKLDTYMSSPKSCICKGTKVKDLFLMSLVNEGES